jgi:hypothetical protein
MWQVTDAESILFVPKPSRRTDCQRHIMPDLGTIARQRPLASAAGGGDCYLLGYSAPRRLRLGHLYTNYRRVPARDLPVQPTYVRTPIQYSPSAHGLLYLELWVRDSEHKSHVSSRRLESCPGDVAIDVVIDHRQGPA